MTEDAAVSSTEESALDTGQEPAQKKSLRRRTSRAKQLAKHIEELESQVENLQSENRDLQDKTLRALADLDNVRKRTDREMSELVVRANAGLIKDLLPILDDFSRSLDPEHQSDEKSFSEGVALMHQKLQKILEDRGVTIIESLSVPFDIALHEAMAQIEHKDTEPGIVVQVYQNGYRMGDTVLRHAKVVVSK